jgi:hypothetical protein
MSSAPAAGGIQTDKGFRGEVRHAGKMHGPGKRRDASMQSAWSKETGASASAATTGFFRDGIRQAAYACIAVVISLSGGGMRG